MRLSCHLKTLMKTPHVLTDICRHHFKVNEDDLTDKVLLDFQQGYTKTSLLDFQQGYTKTSLHGDDYDLTSLGAEIDFKMNLKPFDRVESLACQCEKIIQTYVLQQGVETNAGKKKWRQVIISKIKPNAFPERLGEALAHPFDTEI
jgi:hypothetical protein